MNNTRFNENVALIKSFMDRLWSILPEGWSPEWKEDRKDDSIELWIRNYNDHTYMRHYLVNVSYRQPEEILFHAATWATRYIVEMFADEKKLQIRNLRNCINSRPRITKVIFNDPATIVFWADGTKTVVKCDDGECFDREKGLAMAVSKKALGNQGNYYNEFKKWLPDKMHVEPNLRVKPNSVTLDCTEASLNPMELCSSKILEEFDKWMAKRYQLRKKGDQNDL